MGFLNSLGSLNSLELVSLAKRQMQQLEMPIIEGTTAAGGGGGLLARSCCSAPTPHEENNEDRQQAPRVPSTDLESTSLSIVFIGSAGAKAEVGRDARNL